MEIELLSQVPQGSADVPKCSALCGQCICNTPLFKKVKRGSSYALVPKRVYAYCPLKDSLAKLYSRNDFATKCEQWRKRQKFPGVFVDIYDGKV